MALSKITNNMVAVSGVPVDSTVQLVEGSVTASASTTGTDIEDTGLSASITPSSSSNKILIIASFNGGGDDAGKAGGFYLYRGSTKLMLQGADYTSSGGASYGGHCLVYLDDPATTSSTTYKVRFNNQSSTGSTRFNTDYSTITGEVAKIYLMEIAQ